MNVREAILKAADSIEQNPGLFRFSAMGTAGCGTPGCALGWISAHIGGNQSGETWGLHDAMFEALGITFQDHGRFYERMSELGGTGWSLNAENCASALRLYADKYHPADKPKHTGLPDSVRAIFMEKVA